MENDNIKKEISLSEEQKKIVEAQITKSILVSASAGSGKTHVLVERIKEILINEKYDINLQDILIMTFTVAATSEMKVRIKKAIEEALEKEKFSNKKKEQLIKELALIQNANISTIDSFCKKILMENYHYLNSENSIYGEFDPAYRIADDKELQILYDSVLDEFLEEKYADKRYKMIFDLYFVKTDDTVIKEMLLDGLNHISKFAWPIEWINDQIKNYEKNCDKSFEKYIEIKIEELYDFDINDVSDIFDEYIKILEKANIKSMSDKSKGFTNYITSLYEIKDRLIKYKGFEHNKENHDLLIEEINSIWTFNKFPSVKKYIDVEVEYYDNLKDSVKSIIDSIKNADKVSDINSVSDKFKYNTIEKLFLKLLLEYFKKVVEEKRRKNIYAISDYAVLALNILYDVKDGERVISERAYDIGNKYKLIFVDEYQDTNIIQEKLIKALSTDKNGNTKNNLFLVGDMKQSIYAFRNAEPKLFKEKEKSEIFDKYYLEENYRSKKCVLDFVNTIFDNIMYEEFGEINYKNNNRLSLPEIFKNDYLHIGPKAEVNVILAKEKNNESEVENDDENVDLNDDSLEKNIINVNDEKTNHSGNEYEAKFIANKIEELVRDGYEYKDIMILSRTYSKFPLIIDALNDRGIPCFGHQKKGFYGREEVNLIIDLLKVIDNPLQDIPLANVLTSEIFSITENELAFIKLIQFDKYYSSKNVLYLYDAIIDFISIDKVNLESDKYHIDLTELDYKVNKFKDLYDEFAFKSRYMSISELISLVYEKTYLKEIMATLPDGNLRIANLNIFYENANSYESTSYVGLFNFIRYIEKINNNTLDEELANVSIEDDNVVNMTTIHQSKGLQYKVVILCGCHTDYNERVYGNKSKCVFDNEYGVSFNVYDDSDNSFFNTPKRDVIIKNKIFDGRKEEIRLLYVALTRAVDKIIVTGYASGNGGSGYKKKSIIESSTRLNDVINAKNYFDLIIPNVEHKGTEYYVYNEISAEELDKYFNDSVTTKKKYKEYSIKSEILDSKFESDSYKYIDLQSIAPKVSVSAIKESVIEENNFNLVKNTIDDAYYKNEDLNEKKIKTISSSERGNAYHRYMQFIDFSNAKYVSHNEKEYVNYSVVDKSKISSFFDSDVAKLMKKAYIEKKLFREHKFMNLISQNEINKYKRIDKEKGGCYDEKNVVVQGIIDAFFINDDGTITLIDYKTDMMDSKYDIDTIKNKLIENYSVQLNVYADVLKKITGLIVKEKLIYSFAIDEWIKVG